MFFLQFIKLSVALLLDILMLLMFLRAILSWIPDASNGPVGTFLFTVTEWVIMPVRNVFEMLNINTAFPIDIPFFVTFILLSVIGTVL